MRVVSVVDIGTIVIQHFDINGAMMRSNLFVRTSYD